ncbi:MAG TPA: hypothetical protein VEA16_19455 [Vicinamibacterales bacterium]|nr:hypothetical protein [Vicinamibacterales bacterium]
MANEQQSPDPIESETQKVTKQTALLNAQIEQLKAERELAAVKNPTTTPLAELQAQTALASAAQELANAQTNARIAQTIGTVSNASYTGAVELKDKAGMLEAKLLATKAIDQAATRIAGEVVSAAARLRKDKSEVTIVLAPGSSFRSPERLAVYKFRVETLNRIFDRVLPAPKPGDRLEGAIAVPAFASAGLEAAGKLLSFFKTDYSVEGVDVSLDESAAMYAIAGALSAHEGVRVKLPLVHLPEERAKATQQLIDDVTGLLTKRQRAAARATLLAADARRAEAELAQAKPEDKADIQAELAGLQSDEAKLKEAISAYDAFVTSLTTPVGTPAREPIADLVADMALERALTVANGSSPGLLLIRLEASGGGILLKKNLLTGLGAAPLYHMGGAAISYLFLHGASGEVIRGGTVAQHGGFTRSDNMQSALAR